MNRHLYHKVPDRMIGTTLFPLNSLPEVDMETYHAAQQKYIRTDRQSLFTFYNPLLDCYWNDVIFLLAVHPQEIVDVMFAKGLRNKYSNCSYYKIDADLLDYTLLGTYQSYIDWSNNRFDLYEKSHFDEYATIPVDTLTYFDEVSKQPRGSRNYFAFNHVPHILYKGTIDISNVEIISTYEPITQ